MKGYRQQLMEANGFMSVAELRELNWRELRTLCDQVEQDIYSLEYARENDPIVANSAIDDEMREDIKVHKWYRDTIMNVMDSML